MRTFFIVFALFLSAFILTNCVFANNVSVTNIRLTGQITDKNPKNSFTMVQFDIAWENSWRDIVNWDAAWLFVKYSTDNGVTWQHATLGTSGHVGPATCIITAASDGKGVFIYRGANGNGAVSYASVQLKWNYGGDGVLDNAAVKVKVFAIEMVYVPQSQFAAGDGATGAGQFTLTTINTANASTAPSGTGSLGGQAGGRPTGQLAMNSAWPNGYNAFYCMKYEITQDQYADFLNTLTATQATTRNPGKSDSRYCITGTHPNFTSAKPYVACNFLNWMDGCAYADWAALRPMTELEFEKACRGDQHPVMGEYAWATTLATPASIINNDGLATESANSGANCVANSTTPPSLGPMRVGCFATSNTTREQAGASYYGIMELTGNLCEQCVYLSAENTQFTGTAGDGYLSASGNGTNSDWPGWVSGEISSGPYVQFRGGSWSSVLTYCQVSSRLANQGSNRVGSYGFRCVRHAP